MRKAPLPAQLLYGRLLATTVQHLLVGGPPPLARLRLVDGRTEPLPLERWLGPIDAADAAVLDRATPPVLDIGCGPGRHSAALRAAGKTALGVDLSPVAVRLARGRGAAAIARSVFADVPGMGHWRTALLLDGNIGIGGDPAGLLRRVATLLSPHGTALVELGAPGSRTYRTRVRLEAPGAVSEWFGWARVAVDGIDQIAADAGLAVGEAVAVEGRWFASLASSEAAVPASGGSDPATSNGTDPVAKSNGPDPAATTNSIEPVAKTPGSSDRTAELVAPARRMRADARPRRRVPASYRAPGPALP